jgi:pimeloyl-ACP methyl ester carboxylesterase
MTICCRSLMLFAVAAVALGACTTPGSDRPDQSNRSQPASTTQILRIPSKDGTLIAMECAGAGPTLIMVHGGVGDRTRWTPMFPLLSSRLTVCAMDRRGHGLSADSADYSLQKEANRISKLILYEPPVQDPVDRNLAVAGKMERLIKDGAREQALVTFETEVVGLSPGEVAAMKSRPAWPELVTSIDLQLRQMYALAAYRFDASRMRGVRQPTLLLIGGDTTSPYLKQAIESLQSSLPNPTQVVLKGQQHNAMDSARDVLANAIVDFLLGRPD